MVVRRQTTFMFDGGAATFFGTSILAMLVSLLTLGLFFPYSVVLVMRWTMKHTYIEGKRLAFFGSAAALFGHWMLWWLLTIVTFGIYGFWVVPRMTRWVVENTDFDPAYAAAGIAPAVAGGPLPTASPRVGGGAEPAQPGISGPGAELEKIPLQVRWVGLAGVILLVGGSLIPVFGLVSLVGFLVVMAVLVVALVQDRPGPGTQDPFYVARLVTTLAGGVLALAGGLVSAFLAVLALPPLVAAVVLALVPLFKQDGSAAAASTSTPVTRPAPGTPVGAPLPLGSTSETPQLGPPPLADPAAPTRTCFQCGTSSSRSMLFCTTCGTQMAPV